ncbi:hypothetical protein ACFCYH_31915 [Streptomyces sp. NPDC056400]|uniref:hypothetical protein n=1 Tax=Streptomyces sp. NPDC056400 TaxID=3345808 RepID=UPI0035DA8395
MAMQLIDALAMEWEPESFHDSFREKVEALMKAKAAGETVEKAEPAAEPTGAVDLMEALRASVERARNPKDWRQGRLPRHPGDARAEGAGREETGALRTHGQGPGADGTDEVRAVREGGRGRHPGPLVHEPRPARRCPLSHTGRDRRRA